MRIVYWIKKHRLWATIVGFFALICILSFLLEYNYHSLISATTTDRNGKIVALYPNSRGQYMRELNSYSPRLESLLLQKEDRYFYLHAGVNPVSLARAFWRYMRDGSAGGSSTISQQLVKTLLGNENDRTLGNKMIEFLYTFALELTHSKRTILHMYENSVYLGRQTQGFAEGAKMYFDKDVNNLTDTEIISLLATISSPSTSDPWSAKNVSASDTLAKRLGVELVKIENIQEENERKYRRIHPSAFELSTLGCKQKCKATIDETLSDSVRDILKRNVAYASEKGATNASAVIISIPDMQILALVGSPDPFATENGAQINMATEPRPVGSTFKPFIFLKGFEKGLRPYTTVEDREYKYEIATGFPLYPKNYDSNYHGTVTLHQALSNSLNVPAVKVLEYVDLSSFYKFLQKDLGFKPIRPLETYQLGIALGGLEMDLTTLTHLFTIFPNGGLLKPLTLFTDSTKHAPIPPQALITKTHKVADEKYIALINAILTDRKTGVDQFGARSNLNLYQSNYGVKTGTSRDYHDSWVVGYTPDYVVGVWMGNTKNTALKELSGTAGAGRAWNEIMELLAGSQYNHNTQLDISSTSMLEVNGETDIGLPGDDVEKARGILAEKYLIVSPHQNDQFAFVRNTTIPLEASSEATWTINGKFLATGKKVNFVPDHTGNYDINASTPDGTRETIRISIVEQ